MKYFLALTLLLTGAVLLSAAEGTTPDVSYVPHDKVAAVLQKGGSMVNQSDLAVQGTHRVKPGGAEIHLKETDVFYVVDGEATVVTGGTVLNQRTGKNPNQIGGSGIEGGHEYHISKGDVMVIPAGVPHWFKETNGIVYYVVKVKKP